MYLLVIHHCIHHGWLGYGLFTLSDNPIFRNVAAVTKVRLSKVSLRVTTTMAPIQTNQRTGRSLKWNRSLQLVDKPTTWTRDNLVFGDVARSVKHKRDGARRGPSDGVTGEGNIRRQSTEGSDIESDVGESSGDLVAGSDDELDDNVSETEDELDGSASDTDNESDGGISDAEDEDDGLDSGNDTLPPAPDTDAAPTLTLNPPGAGIRTVPVPTDTTIPPASATSEDIIVVSPTGSPDLSMITMTAIVSRPGY